MFFFWNGNKTITGDLNESTASDMSRAFGPSRKGRQVLWDSLEGNKTSSEHNGTHYIQQIKQYITISVGNL